CSSRISPLSPTMARSFSRTAELTGVVGIGGWMTLSGMFPRVCGSLAAAIRPVIRGRPAQPVVDRQAQSGLRNGHDGDAGDLGPIERPEVGEKVGGGFGEVAGGAEIEAHPGARQ